MLQDAAKLTPEQETTLLSAREMMLGRTAMLASQQQPLLVRLQASLLLPSFASWGSWWAEAGSFQAFIWHITNTLKPGFFQAVTYCHQSAMLLTSVLKGTQDNG